MPPRRLPELDLLQDCVTSVQEKSNQRISPDHVTRTCCKYCRHPKCKRAGWAESRWQGRMDTQVDYLLDNPHFSDLTLPSHMEIHDFDWGDIRRQALKLEVSRRRGDWAPVTDADIDGPTDGVIEVGSEASVNAVDQALKALAKKRGQPVPHPPRIVAGIEDPTVSGTLPENPAPTPLRTKTKQPTAAQLQKMAQMATRMGVHVEEDDAPEPAPQETDEAVPREPEREVQRRSAPPPSYLGNTPVPRGGIMVTDEESTAPAAPTPDTWAPKSKDRVVKQHARIQLGKKDE